MVVYYQIAGKQVGSHVVRSLCLFRHIFLIHDNRTGSKSLTTLQGHIANFVQSS